MRMHTSLYLTAGESKLFAALPSKLREGWDVEEERLGYHDSPERRRVRLDLMDLADKRFEKIAFRCGPTCSERDLEQLVREVDFTGLSQTDLWEICFALGPSVIGYLISKILMSAKNDKEMEGVMAFSHLRHELLISLQPARS